MSVQLRRIVDIGYTVSFALLFGTLDPLDVAFMNE